MPVVLIIAFAASLGVHALVLFAPDIDLSVGSEPPALVAELKAPPPLPPPPPPQPQPQPQPQPAAKPKAKVVATKATLARRKTTAPRPLQTAAESPALTPDMVATPSSAQASTPDEPAQEPDAAPTAPAAQSTAGPAAPAAAQLPARGMIRYRVDRGDQGFAIGFSTHDWEVVDGAYRITAVTETSGLVGLLRPLRFEVESRGRWTAAGLLPEVVVSRQPGRETGQRAEFDWKTMQMRVGDRPAQALRVGTQDLLSFPYQLGLLPDLAAGSSLPILTGKRYSEYRVEVVGDEEITVPAGTFRCRHLRVPGVATTELWLAYERALLPVKIQHLDRKGDLYVQVATAIEISQEAQ